jgi:hypothetical protein
VDLRLRMHAMWQALIAHAQTCRCMPTECRYARLRQHCLAQQACSVLGAWVQLLAAGRHRRRMLLRRCFSEWLELCQLTWKLLSKVRAACCCLLQESHAALLMHSHTVACVCKPAT